MKSERTQRTKQRENIYIFDEETGFGTHGNHASIQNSGDDCNIVNFMNSLYVFMTGIKCPAYQI